mgnify:FL=1
MSPREAFEAALTRAIEEQKDPRFYSTIDAINWAWQAAIQHASDVAVRACESRIMGDHNREDQEAQRCADAIKEALK